MSNKHRANFEAQLKSDLQTADVSVVEIEMGTTADSAADILRIEAMGFFCRERGQRGLILVCV